MRWFVWTGCVVAAWVAVSAAACGSNEADRADAAPASSSSSGGTPDGRSDAQIANAESDADAVCVELAPGCTGLAPDATTAPANALLRPAQLRGMFWKQWKDANKDEHDHDGLHYPGDFGIDRARLIRYLVEQQEVNVVVVDLNENPEDQDLPGVGKFIADLYHQQRCLRPDAPPPIHVYLHARAYFSDSEPPKPADADKLAARAAAVHDTLAAVAQHDPAALSIVDGYRWGENGDTDMAPHLRSAIRLADQINESNDGWLTTHGFIVNGLGYGASFVGLDAADRESDFDPTRAGKQSFAEAISHRVGVFSWAYKHFVSVGGEDAASKGDGMKVFFEQYCAEMGLPDDDPASWRSLFEHALGFGSLASWLTAHGDRPQIANLITIGDSGDGANKTTADARIAIGQEMAALGQDGRIFMIPFGLEGDPYYHEQTVTAWLTPASADPTTACVRRSQGDVTWRTLIE